VKSILLLANTAMYMRHLELLERHLEVLLLVCVCERERDRERERQTERERECVLCVIECRTLQAQKHLQKIVVI